MGFNSAFKGLKPPSSCLRLLPRLPVTSILPSILPSITCFRRQLLRKMSPIQFCFLLFNVCRTFLSFLSLYNTSVTHYTKPLACKKNVNSSQWIKKKTCLPVLDAVLMWHRGNDVSKIRVSGYTSTKNSDCSETAVNW